MRIMGLDVGTKTVGVAISDALGWTAQGIETVKIDEEAGEFGIERIKSLVKEYAVTEFVVGYPKNMNNTVGPRGEASENYKNRVFAMLKNYGYSTEALHPVLNGKIPENQVKETLLFAMKKDKKNSSSTVRFVLQSDIKKTVIQEVSDSEVAKVL